MNNKTKHACVDSVAVGFMAISLIGYFFIHPIFLLLLALGVLTMALNEKYNPYDANQKQSEVKG